MLRYIPAFDGLRALAVMLVIISHWLPDTFAINYLPNGMMGVSLFFVLSGYLITRILYQDKQEDRNGKSLAVFYYRRLLRIFPIYYLVLLLILFTNYNHLRPHLGWFFSYLQNIYFISINDWSGGVAPYWTLAVEEQFYIFWPFVILFLNPKWILRITLLCIFLSPLFRLLAYSCWSEMSSAILTPSCFDCLALGAFLALKESAVIDKLRHRINSYVLISAAAFAAWLFILNYLPGVYDAVFTRSIFSVFCFLLLTRCIIGSKSSFNFLSNRYLVQMGKISYGIYLYHMIIFLNVNYLLRHILVFAGLGHNSQAMYYLWPLHFMVLILVSALSYRFIEKPLMKYKDRFNYLLPGNQQTVISLSET